MTTRSFVKLSNDEVVRYDLFVLSLFKEQSHEMMLYHALTGMASEVGEIADCVKKHLAYEQEMNFTNLIEELGDLRFYIQALMNLYGISEETVLQRNAEKLEKRYQGLKYSNEAAFKRADKERGRED